MDVSDGIGFVWVIPPGFRLVLQCLGPITHEGAFIGIGLWCGEIKWQIPPAEDGWESHLQPIVRYPAPALATTERALTADYWISLRNLLAILFQRNNTSLQRAPVLLG